MADSEIASTLLAENEDERGDLGSSRKKEAMKQGSGWVDVRIGIAKWNMITRQH